MEDIWGDVRYGFRSLASNRRFSGIALLTIALAVGGITTVFTLVNSILLRPLPYPAADRLVLLRKTAPNGTYGWNSSRDYTAISREVSSFESTALFQLGYVNTLDAETDPLVVHTIAVTPGLFPILGIRTVIGRPLLPEDAKVDSPAVAVIGYDLWRNRFGGKPDILGKPLRFTQKTLTIVGVTAQETDLPANRFNDPPVFTAAREPFDSDSDFYRVIARLRPGASVASANAELESLSGRFEKERPELNRGNVINAKMALAEIVGDTREVLWIFLGAVSCVLMIGIANLISLQIVRNSSREHEICIRAALGAGRGRLVRQLLVETLLLSFAGGVAGIVLAWGGTRLMVATVPAHFPRTDQITLDSTVFVFAFAISLLVGVAFGIVPALRASRPGLMGALNEGSRNTTLSTGRLRLQRTLIAFEVAVALVLLVGASLLLNSFGRLITEDAGMQERGLWAVNVTLPLRYRTAESQIRFWKSALESIRGLGQVQAATLMVNGVAPLSGGDSLAGGILPEGKAASPRDALTVSWRRIGADYFSTLGIRVIKGRAIEQSDMASADPVGVVNQFAATKFWPGEDPIGKRLVLGKRLVTVIGVIPDYQISNLARPDMVPQMYLAYLQEPSVSMGARSAVIMLRTKPDTASGLASAVRAALGNMEKDAVIGSSSLADVRWKALASERFRTSILLVFAAGAVFLALVGIFGVVSYSVVQRNREIGLRRALGAANRDVLRLMLRQALAPAMIGLAAGIPGALAAARLLSAYLFEIKPADPFTFAAAVIILGGAAFVAGLLPAHRALLVDPLVALRYE